jgi:hypothetical protein
MTANKRKLPVCKKLFQILLGLKRATAKRAQKKKAASNLSGQPAKKTIKRSINKHGTLRTDDKQPTNTGTY